ncbi:hypothetical protein OJ997_28940 [Solirubrobacter phytolaccae]|uniref:Phosphoribosyltransferase domain-containing protein n=1 Tax=Solirubrobacter phytolaccae TaxID=1404360 RepID=A0A9X3NE24_9ACTN|nr:hypothetical protein [Solirubrobacter phytolaccae]MDA0184366.1 hypothetical protein [Solirubrobacter phytolaccae]
MTLTVTEAAATYVNAMRNVLPAGPGVCDVCHTFIDPGYSRCYACSSQPSPLDVVVPITYSEHLSQMHKVLRSYKDGDHASQRYMMPRLASILWLFLESHEVHVAAAVNAQQSQFDIVTSVPSSTPDGDERRANLRWIVGLGCHPTAQRYERVLHPTGGVAAGREFNEGRYVATVDVVGKDVLLIDDTWTRGGHAQSAGAALKAAGARTVGFVVIGRHISPGWRPRPPDGPTSAELLAGLPRGYSWDTCCLER